MKTETLEALGLTKEQIDAIMAENGKDIAVVRNKLTAAETKLGELKNVETELETLKTANLTAEEKAAKAIKDAEAQKAKYARMQNTLKAKEVLIAAGLVEDDFKDFIDGIVSDDENRTVTLAKSLATVVKNKSDAAAQQKEQELLKDTPKPPSNAGGGSKFEAMTKDKFFALPYTEMLEYKAQNPETAETFLSEI